MSAYFRATHGDTDTVGPELGPGICGFNSFR